MSTEAKLLLEDLLASADHPLIAATIVPVAAEPARFAGAFYARLFALAPGLRALFPADLSAQGLKLARTLVLIVSAHERIDTMTPMLRELGARHRGYGVKPMHYRLAGSVLLDALAEVNGDTFNDAARAAWSRLYAHVAREMQAG
jgi:nitric oxide dioxygenase